MFCDLDYLINKIDDERIWRLFWLIGKGYNGIEIAKKLGVSKPTLIRLKEKMKEIIISPDL